MDDAQQQIENLAAAILELDLRGTEDGGAVDIAILRLREQKALLAQSDEAIAASYKRWEEDHAKIAELENALKAEQDKSEKILTRVLATEGKGRKLKAVTVDGGEDPAAKAQALLGMIGEAIAVELVAADAKNREIPNMAFAIGGGVDAWRLTAQGLQLAAHVEVPFHNGETQRDVAAYGLFLDGKQAAFRERFELLTIKPMQMTELGGDVLL